MSGCRGAAALGWPTRGGAGAPPWWGGRRRPSGARRGGGAPPRLATPAPRPRAAGSGRQRDVGVAEEGVVDDALHRVDLSLAAPLEPEREVGIRVRGAHEPPAAVGEQHARAVDIDRLVALLQLARQLLDELELLVVRAQRLELGRGVQVLDRLEQAGGRARLAGDDLPDLASGQQAVVHPVVALGEEHVAADLAAEQGLVVAHLALEVRVAGLPHHGHPAVALDVLYQRLRGLHVEDDLGAGMPL